VKTLVLFDFDGTITNEDTLFTFIKYYHGRGKYLAGLLLLSPILCLHLLNIISNQRAKEAVLTWFFRGSSIDHFNKACTHFSRIVDSIARPAAIAKLIEFKKQGYQIAVVTASPENWVKPWCDKNSLSCIATKLEIQGDKLTGKIKGHNCNGIEKEKRIRSEYDLASFDHIIAFGDSRGDQEMLKLAHVQFYKPFRN